MAHLEKHHLSVLAVAALTVATDLDPKSATQKIYFSRY